MRILCYIDMHIYYIDTEGTSALACQYMYICSLDGCTFSVTEPKLSHIYAALGLESRKIWSYVQAALVIHVQLDVLIWSMLHKSPKLLDISEYLKWHTLLCIYLIFQHAPKTITRL